MNHSNAIPDILRKHRHATLDLISDSIVDPAKDWRNRTPEQNVRELDMPAQLALYEAVVGCVPDPILHDEYSFEATLLTNLRELFGISKEGEAL